MSGTREQILSEAERLLVATGDPGAVSMRAIAVGAGVTAPTIYRNFADKDELLAAACTEWLERFEHDVIARVAGTADPLDQVVAIGAAYADFAMANPGVFRVLFMTPSPTRHTTTESGARVLALVTATVARAISAGAIEPGDAQLVAATLWAAVHGLVTLRLAKGDGPLPPYPQHRDQLLEVLRRGLQRGR